MRRSEVLQNKDAGEFELLFCRVAGWKQQQHPVLYYAFHVGDQILKVAGVTVQSSVEANRAIKMASNLQVSCTLLKLREFNDGVW